MIRQTSQLYTIGYQGYTPEEFIEDLIRQKIDVLVDVRQRAGSRKRGFAKSALIAATAAQKIEYVHVPGLGTPANLRRQLRADELRLPEYLALFREYAATQNQQLADLLALTKQSRCCLLCVERKPAECHRAVIAELLQQRHSGSLEIMHLGILPTG